MVLVALLGLLLIVAAVAFFASAALRPGVRRAENLDHIALYGYGGIATEEKPKRAIRKSLDDLAGAVGSFTGGRVRGLREDEIQRRLLSAGFFGIGARRFIGYRVLLTIALPLLTIWLLGLAGAATAAIALLAAGAAIFGWVVPSIVLSRRARSRLEQIDYALPELIDLLIVTLESGVAFAAALRIAADRLEGPLGDEVRLTIQEQSLGLGMGEALENWLTRCDTPSVRSFVRSMVQGEALGVSIGQILRNLAVEMRARRKQAIEERAQKAPIKILFPLVFLIFPAMFLIILGPVMYTLSGGFGG
jgi:tight adherence protein C